MVGRSEPWVGGIADRLAARNMSVGVPSRRRLDPGNRRPPAPQRSVGSLMVGFALPKEGTSLRSISLRSPRRRRLDSGNRRPRRPPESLRSKAMPSLPENVPLSGRDASQLPGQG